VLVVGGLGLAGGLGVIDGRGLALAAGALCTVVFARALATREATGHDGPFSRAMAERHPPEPPNRLRELERSLDLATISASEAHRVLRPLVVDVAGTWLQGTHGIDLEDPRAPTLLPADVWALASPRSGRPAEPHGPGFTPADLDALISQLEALP
jgi:hypothetical protein